MFRFDRAELGDVILMVMSRHHGRVLYGFMPQTTLNGTGNWYMYLHCGLFFMVKNVGKIYQSHFECVSGMENLFFGHLKNAGLLGRSGSL